MVHMPNDSEGIQEEPLQPVEESSTGKPSSLQLHNELEKIEEKQKSGEELNRQELALVYGLVKTDRTGIQFLREPEELLIENIVSHRTDPRNDLLALIGDRRYDEHPTQRFAKRCSDLVFSGQAGSIEYLQALKEAIPRDYEGSEIYLFNLANSLYYAKLDENPQGKELVKSALGIIENAEHPSLRTLRSLAYTLGNRRLHDNDALDEDNVATILSIISLNLENAPSGLRNREFDVNSTYKAISRTIGRGLLKGTNLSDAAAILLDTGHIDNLNIEIARDTAQQVRDGVFGKENDPSGIALSTAMRIIETQLPSANRIVGQLENEDQDRFELATEMLTLLSEAVSLGNVPESSLVTVLKVIETTDPKKLSDPAPDNA